MLSTHFGPMFPFFTPWKHQKSLLMFSGGKEREYGLILRNAYGILQKNVFWTVEKLMSFWFVKPKSRHFSIIISQFRIMANRWKFYIELIFSYYRGKSIWYPTLYNHIVVATSLHWWHGFSAKPSNL